MFRVIAKLRAFLVIFILIDSTYKILIMLTDVNKQTNECDLTFQRNSENESLLNSISYRFNSFNSHWWIWMWFAKCMKGRIGIMGGAIDRLGAYKVTDT